MSSPGNFEPGETIPISTGSSLWIAQGASHGMIEILPDCNTLASVVAFPEEFIYTSQWLMFCKYKGDCIIVISRANLMGTVFDTKTREFKEVFTWQVKERSRLTICSSCIVIGDYLHIVHDGWYGDYSIYSISSKTTRIVEVGVEQKEIMPTVIKSNVLNQASYTKSKEHSCSDRRSYTQILPI